MVQIYDNVFSPKVLEKVQEVVFGEELPWFSTNITHHSERDPRKYTWAHVAYSMQPNTHIGSFLELALFSALDNVGIPVDKMYRIRLALTTPTGDHQVGDPHVDLEMAHMTGVLYLTPSDGNTIMYNEFYDPSRNRNMSDYYTKVLGSKLTVSEEITPKVNSMIIFPGFQYHSSNTPVNTGRRIVINFNFSLKEDLIVAR